MRFVTFRQKKTSPNPRIGLLQNGRVVDLPRCVLSYQAESKEADFTFPSTLLEMIEAGEEALHFAERVAQWVNQLDPEKQPEYSFPITSVNLLAPIPKPPTIRDFYAFEDHVKTAFGIRGNPVPQAWYSFPVFYFSNPGAVYGPGAEIPIPRSTQEMDYELEVACVVGKEGRNLSPEEAENYIFGFTIMNDWSARDVQRAETQARLGPAKGKDFATSLGPSLVTLDDLASLKTGRPGVFDLQMTARVNGQEGSRGNMRDLHYSFGEMIARASQDCTLYPGDVIGSGTVGSGCLLELTGGKGPWLQPGDQVELEIECLGKLVNRVV